MRLLLLDGIVMGRIDVGQPIGDVGLTAIVSLTPTDGDAMVLPHRDGVS
jgi:hypothetical protein